MLTSSGLAQEHDPGKPSKQNARGEKREGCHRGSKAEAQVLRAQGSRVVDKPIANEANDSGGEQAQEQGP